MSTYLITGATGYIGSMLVKQILDSGAGDSVIALVRDVEKAKAFLPQGVSYICVNLEDRQMMESVKGSITGSIHCNYIIHCASVTKSSEMIARPVETIESIVNTTQNVMELAKICDVKSVVYLSSMEVYGNIDCLDGHRVSEAELGDVNIFNERSCYPLGKRMAENVCYAYHKEYNVPVKIARLAQTFGRGVLPNENRVFVQFAKAVKYSEDIVLHTAGNSMGNYCSIDDAMTGIMNILHHGVNGEAYNVVNEENTMTIREMAELVADRIAKGKIKVVYDIPEGNPFGYGTDTGLRLSSKKLNGLGWKAADDICKMYKELLDEI